LAWQASLAKTDARFQKNNLIDNGEQSGFDFAASVVVPEK